MEKKFVKMESLGNDFVIFEENYQDFSKEQIQFIANRNLGIGCDQIIFITPVKNNKLEMFVFNCDGSMAETCGNAIRCVALLAKIKHNIDKLEIILINSYAKTKIKDTSIETNIGHVSFELQNIIKNPNHFKITNMAIPSFQEPIMVDVGNPHIVYFVEKNFPARGLLKDYGLKVQKHPALKNGINVNFAKIINRQTINLNVLERGVGDFTLACGTGAVATFAAALNQGLIEDSAIINLEGGSLQIFDKNGDIFVVGNASLVFRGEISL